MSSRKPCPCPRNSPPLYVFKRPKVKPAPKYEEEFTLASLWELLDRAPRQRKQPGWWVSEPDPEVDPGSPSHWSAQQPRRAQNWGASCVCCARVKARAKRSRHNQGRKPRKVW